MARTGTEVADATFAFVEGAFTTIADDLVGAASDAAMADARQRWEEIKPGLPYLDEPRHPMALSMFSCAATLAAYLPLRERGVDAHDFGARVHEEFARIAPAGSDGGLTEDVIEAAGRSHDAPADGEFVYAVRGVAGDTKWELEIQSCAISKLFSRFDAMELVPYMCALDDVFSDRSGRGLRRTGTIALGATHCDFHYDAGGEPLRLVEQYPDRIRLR